MSWFFILHNLHFALELIGALVFLMGAWLSFDAYLVRPSSASVLKTIGFSLLAVWQVVHSFGAGGDVGNYVASIIYIAGLLVVIVSFMAEAKPLTTRAIIILPAFGALLIPVRFIEFAGLAVIAFLAYRKANRDLDPAQAPLWKGFSLLALGALFGHFYGLDSVNAAWGIGHIFELAGFVSLAWWVWQYLRLRLHESLILIFVSASLFIATAVTLAFSTILINRIEHETEQSLLTDVRVLDFAIQGLKEEASAKVQLLALNEKLPSLIQKNSVPELESLATGFLDAENLGFLTVTDENGIVLMRAHAVATRGDDISKDRTVDEALQGKPYTTIKSGSAEKFSIRASAPVYSAKNKIIGVLVAGFPLDSALVDKIKRVTGLDMSVYEGDIAVANTALNVDGRSRIIGIRLADTAVADAVLSRGEAITVRTEILSRPFLASYLPITNGDNAIVGMLSAAKPQQDILELANATNRLTLATVIILLLILSTPIYFLTRRLISAEI